MDSPVKTGAWGTTCITIDIRIVHPLIYGFAARFLPSFLAGPLYRFCCYTAVHYDPEAG